MYIILYLCAMRIDCFSIIIDIYFNIINIYKKFHVFNKTIEYENM